MNRHEQETKFVPDISPIPISPASAGGVSPYARPAVVLGQTQIGSSVVMDVIGEGGMATVYKVWNEGLEVFRAVKLLSREASSVRFETEAKIIAKLRHEGIVEVYSTGSWNGLPYMEMEFVDGPDLQQTLSERGRLPETVSVAIASLAAEALAHAHTQSFTLVGKQYCGIIHRDLKPANIMLSKNGEVKLTDFGIARPAQASLHTVDGAIIGTMHYLSPEQMDGADVDNRSDIYSFGTILYEMITGSRTFPQESITELMVKKSTNKFKSPLEYGISMSERLENIMLRCLKFAPAERYQSTQDLADDLRKLLGSLTKHQPKDVLKNYFSGAGGADYSDTGAMKTPETRYRPGERDGSDKSWASDKPKTKTSGFFSKSRMLVPLGRPRTVELIDGAEVWARPKKSKWIFLTVLLLLVAVSALSYLAVRTVKERAAASGTREADDVGALTAVDSSVPEPMPAGDTEPPSPAAAPAQPPPKAAAPSQPEPEQTAKAAAPSQPKPAQPAKAAPPSQPKPDPSPAAAAAPATPRGDSKSGRGVYLQRTGGANAIASELAKVLEEKVPLSNGQCADGVTVSFESPPEPSCVESMVGIVCKADVSLVVTQCGGGQRTVLRGSLVGSDKTAEDLAKRQFIRNIKTAKFWDEWVKELGRLAK